MATQLPDGSVFLAVDRFAVRTLCWRVDNGRLRVAARADTLADAPDALGIRVAELLLAQGARALIDAAL